MARKIYTANEIIEAIDRAFEREQWIKRDVGLADALQGIRADVKRIGKMIDTMHAGHPDRPRVQARFRKLVERRNFLEKLARATPRGRALFMRRKSKVKIRYQIGKWVV